VIQKFSNRRRTACPDCLFSIHVVKKHVRQHKECQTQVHPRWCYPLKIGNVNNNESECKKVANKSSDCQLIVWVRNAQVSAWTEFGKIAKRFGHRDIQSSFMK
jgi:hypothetical protein